jgi:beta-glucosidase
MAQKSMVLLKNEKMVLPVALDNIHSIMITGPNAYSFDALSGNYHGVASHMVSFVEGITSAAGPGTRIEYDQGSDYRDTAHFGGTWAASNADLTIAVIGLTPVMEGEEGDAFLAPHGGDKVDLELPAAHIAYIKALRKSIRRKPLIAVVTAGSPIDLSPIEPYVDGIILAWYPGEQGGNALADILFGKVSPSGHLPVTFYRSLADLPSYQDYGMKGRTYRYYSGPVQYPFGYGLSYTSFTYNWQEKPKSSYTVKDTIGFMVSVANDGGMDGDEVVQAYIEYPSSDRMPLKELKAFQRVTVLKGQTKNLHLSIPASDIRKWDLATGKWKLYPGRYTIVLGSHSRDEKLTASFNVK